MVNHFLSYILHKKYFVCKYDCFLNEVQIEIHTFFKVKVFKSKVNWLHCPLPIPIFLQTNLAKIKFFAMTRNIRFLLFCPWVSLEFYNKNKSLRDVKVFQNKFRLILWLGYKLTSHNLNKKWYKLCDNEGHFNFTNWIHFLKSVPRFPLPQSISLHVEITSQFVKTLI